MRIFAICLLTSIGFIIGCIGILLMPDIVCVVFLLLSLIIDVIDGILARRLNASSNFGAILDWTVDTALSYMIAYRCAGIGYPIVAVAACSVLMVIQTLAKYTNARFSGRSLVTIISIIWIINVTM